MSYDPILPTSRIEFIKYKACGCSFVERVEKDPCSWIFKKGIYCPDCGSKIEDSILEKLRIYLMIKYFIVDNLQTKKERRYE